MALMPAVAATSCPRLPLHSLPQAFVHQALLCLQMVFRAFGACLLTAGPLLPPRAVTTGTSYSLPAYDVHSHMVERMDRDHKGCAKLIHLISYEQLQESLIDWRR